LSRRRELVLPPALDFYVASAASKSDLTLDAASRADSMVQVILAIANLIAVTSKFVLEHIKIQVLELRCHQ